MTVTPRQGIIKPFAQLKVTIRFSPQMPPPARGFINQFQAESTEVRQVMRKVFVDCIEMNQRLTLNLTGSCSSPNVEISPSTLRFGNCPVHDRRDILLRLTNKSDSRTSFDFSGLAHFKINPNNGFLEPKQNISIIASFLPTQLGVFKHEMTMTLQDGLVEKKIHVVAESDSQIKKTMIGGIDKLPEDFKKAYKFVDPEEVSALRQSKKDNKTFKAREAGAPFHRLQDDKTFASKNSDVEENDSLYVDDEDDKSLKSVDSSHPFKLRQANEKIYNDYLNHSQKRRTHTKQLASTRRMRLRGAADRNDPWGVDMGMERGLEEPDMRIPRAGEPLWLANSEGGAKSRPTLDENRLIQKKYPATPATQAEMRDCSSELSPEDMSMVSASHKIVDFGRVCVGSHSAKSFSVTNELQCSVLVALGDLESEMKQSRPDAQVIPAGAVAGYDIAFTSKTLGKYKKGFSWKMNGHHTFRVIVTAEVVPIELEFNKTNLAFEFEEGNLEPHVSQDILLKNTGNATAEFLWGNAGAFECKPEKGNIGPQQTAIVSVVWTPIAGKRNEEELSCHIPGGVDQTLSVSGVVETTKVMFEKTKLSVGTIAVGAEHKMEAVLKNTGT